MARRQRLETPDGRYFVSRGRLWRQTDPRLDDSERRAAVKALMQARRAGQLARIAQEAHAARTAVEAAKLRLGEAGPVWWEDGAPDETGQDPARSTYAEWWAALPEDVRAAADGAD